MMKIYIPGIHSIGGSSNGDIEHAFEVSFILYIFLSFTL